MKALIMAAGLGTRISRYLNGNPKCTVSLGDETLIEYTVNLLHENGINDIGIVIGYRGEVIRNLLINKRVVFYENPFYDVTNSIASTWFAQSFIDDDMLLMNADVFIDQAILDQILKSKFDPVMFADEARINVADYRFKYEDHILEKFGKDLPNEETTGEYIGIAKFSKKFVPVFLESLNNLINNQQHGFWWENVLYTLISKDKIYVENCGHKFWAEVDYIEDYERIRKHLEEKKTK
jgi:choline kinase